jgi:uncharacterized protein with NAD-binding domain and iron-sulfur cluster
MSNKVKTAVIVTSEKTANVIMESVVSQTEKVVDYSALVAERVKGIKTISLKVENLSGVETLNKLSAGNVNEIVSLMQESFSDEKVSKLLKLAMDFLSDSIVKAVKVKNDAGKTRSCRLDLTDDTSASALAYKAMVDLQAVIIKRNSAFKKVTLAIA